MKTNKNPALRADVGPPPPKPPKPEHLTNAGGAQQQQSSVGAGKIELDGGKKWIVVSFIHK